MNGIHLHAEACNLHGINCMYLQLHVPIWAYGPVYVVSAWLGPLSIHCTLGQTRLAFCGEWFWAGLGLGCAACWYVMKRRFIVIIYIMYNGQCTM